MLGFWISLFVIKHIFFGKNIIIDALKDLKTYLIKTQGENLEVDEQIVQEQQIEKDVEVVEQQIVEEPIPKQVSISELMESPQQPQPEEQELPASDSIAEDFVPSTPNLLVEAVKNFFAENALAKI